MIYVMSDLHGCYEKYSKMLTLIDLKAEDTLYILGDIVDRGPDGIKILLELKQKKNIVALRGNHDHKSGIMLKRLMQSEGSPGRKQYDKQLAFWLADGGGPTRDAFLALPDEEKREVIAYLRIMPFYKMILINGQPYFLSHTVPEKGAMPRNPELCTGRDLVWGEPEYGKEYYKDIILVTGHTPTVLIDKNSMGKIWKGNNHIAVDCGAVFGNPLGCICLDTMEEFYVD